MRKAGQCCFRASQCCGAANHSVPERILRRGGRSDIATILRVGQVIIMCIASVFGCITLFGMGAALYADLTKKGDYESPGETKSA